MHLRKLLVASICAAGLVLTSACSGGAEADDAGSDTLTVGWSDFGNGTLDPAYSAATEMLFQDGLYDFLTYQKRQPKSATEPEWEMEPGLATSWDISDDGLTWTIQIREGVTFHDGTPLTAADVKFSLDLYRSDAATTPRKSVLRGLIDDVQVDGDHTVVIKAKVANPWLLKVELSNIHDAPVLPAAYYEKVGPEGFAANPIGSGPYKFVRAVTNEEVELEAVEGVHWRGEAAFKRLVFKRMPAPATRIAALQSGQVDLIDVPSLSVRELEGVPGVELVRVPSSTNQWISFGATYLDDPKNPLHDVRVREAMNLAIDHEGLVNAVYGGNATPTGSWFFNPGGVGWDASLQPHPYDPDRARQLLAEAGFPNGFEIEMATFPLPPAAELPALGEAVALSLGQIGIKVNIKQTTYAIVQPDLATFPGLYPFRLSSNPDKTTSIPLFLGESSHDFIPMAWGGEVDTLVKAILAEPDPEKRDPLSRQLNKLLYDEYLGIPIVVAQAVVAVNKEKLPDYTVFPSINYKIHLVKQG